MSRRRPGFTLIELLVVIAIIAILIALIMPAVQSVREAARKTQCRNNLKQLGTAIANYYTTKNTLPPAYIVRSSAGPDHVGYGWGVFLLPYLDQKPLFDMQNFSANPIVLPQESLSVFVCASDPYTGQAQYAAQTPGFNDPMCMNPGYSGWGSGMCMGQVNQSTPGFAAKGNYVANFGSTALGPAMGNGVMGPNSFLPVQGIRDGSSNTFYLGERASPGSASWAGVTYDITATAPSMMMTNPPTQLSNTSGKHVLGTTQSQINASSTGFGSPHVGGCHMLMGDNSLKFISENISLQVFQALSTRSGAEPIGSNY